MTLVSVPRVLCVDDEPEVLEGVKLTLRKRFQVALARSGAEGLARLRNEGPFAVVLSDMRMPAMDGVGFLARARELAPTTVRILLTGVNDLTTAIHVVNDGQIFRFLTKPCPPKQLFNAVSEAAAQHRLIASANVLFEEVLPSCVRTLTDLLALGQPAAFGRAVRVARFVCALGSRLGATPLWELEVAALLSQTGCAALPPQTAERLYFGRELGQNDQALVSQLPAATEELLHEIPRLDDVRMILALQDRRFDGRGTHPDGVAGEDLPFGARLLKVALDYDTLESQGVAPDRRLAALRAREGWYDPKILDALGALLENVQPASRELGVGELRPGMLLAQDVLSAQGALLVARGSAVTAAVRARLANAPGGVQEPLHVVVPEAS